MSSVHSCKPRVKKSWAEILQDLFRGVPPILTPPVQVWKKKIRIASEEKIMKPIILYKAR
jgi:hypothetical protein